MKPLTALLVFVVLRRAVAVSAQELWSAIRVNTLLSFPPANGNRSRNPIQHASAPSLLRNRMDAPAIRKEIVDAGTTPADGRCAIRTRSLDTSPDLSAANRNLLSRLSGVTASYEFTKAGKPMMAHLLSASRQPHDYACALPACATNRSHPQSNRCDRAKFQVKVSALVLK